MNLVCGIDDVLEVEPCLLEALCCCAVQIGRAQRWIIPTYVCRFLPNNIANQTLITSAYQLVL